MFTPQQLSMKLQVTTIRKFTDSLSFMNLPVFNYIEREDFAIVKMEELGMELPCQTPAFRPDHYSIILLENGTATYLIGDKVFELSPNHILFIRPNAFLFSEWISVHKAYYITFSKQFLLQYWPTGIDLIEKLDPCMGYSSSLAQEMMENIQSLCHDMYNEALSNSTFKYELISNLILNLLLLIRQKQYVNEDAGNPEKYNSRVTAFLHDMDENFSQISSGKTHTLLRIKDYAGMQNVNENYLSKIVSLKTGKSVNQWIHEKLITEIKYLLQHSDKPMKEIAILYGFNDLNYFYSYFKRHTQNAPGFLRRNFNSLKVDEKNVFMKINT
jgi:AraC family transcriptional activator of pobA